MKQNEVIINDGKRKIIISNTKPITFIAGTCVIESYTNYRDTVKKLKDIFSKLNVNFIAKASFDKANRSSLSSFRGPGIEEGIKILRDIKEEFNIPVLVDIHLPEQAEKVKDVCDIIQIPAFLCRQTDLILAAAETGRAVNVKKGQFLSPWEIENIIKKIESRKNRKIMITERGTTFGYNNLIVDMRSIKIIKEFGYPVIFDATHSVQKPGGLGNKSGGDRKFVMTLAKSAVINAIAGLFFETHINPDTALSDGPNSIKLSDVYKFAKIIKKIDMLAKQKELDFEIN